jgi:hypothetical protein
VTPPTITERIAGWRPADLPSGVDPDWVVFVRDAVAAAGPRSDTETRNALRWCAEYVTAALHSEMALNPATLFAADRVDAYRATLSAPTGTKDAMASILKRLHPSVGLAGTTRGRASATATGQQTKSPVVVLPGGRRPTLTVEVVEAIDTFVPTLLAAELWAPIQTLVREAVRAVAPASVQRARTLCRDMAYLTAWLLCQHRMLAPAVILKAATIEEFLGVLLSNGRPPRSVASYASNLHAVREAHGLPLDVTRRAFQAASPKAPYNMAEVDRFYEQVARIPSRGRRRNATAALNLMFGAGAFPAEAASVAPADVQRSPDGVKVALPGRDVPVTVLPAYADVVDAAAAAARAARERFLLGGSAMRRDNRLNQIFRGSGPRWRVTVDSRRARATWLVEVVATPGLYPTLVDMFAATGLHSFQRIVELYDDIAARHRELTDAPLPNPSPPTADRFDRDGSVAS